MNLINDGGRVSLSELSLPEDLKKLSLRQCRYLCSEIRSKLVSVISNNGGHLASNLGVVELTMAIHRNFDSPDDRIIWDVGHQSYVHKILTGRLEQFQTIRQDGGISGFPKPEESEHDVFICGHSSNSISAGCGMMEAMRLQGKDNNYVVAVVGDGAMTGGMFYEGMNNGGREKNSNLIVILNDNDMSISKSVGSLAGYLTSLRNTEKYLHTKRRLEKNIVNIPIVGTRVAKGIKNAKDSIKSAILEKTIFEDMGFVYLGPVNGHSLSELEQVMHMAKSYHCPVFVHVRTIKGKGYLPAEQNPGEYHGISRFDIVTGNPEVSADDSYSTVFGKELVRLAEQDDRICAITAAMKYGTGLQYFAERFPERFYDVGIAEQHAVTFAGGLASMGQIPVFAVYSTFLQRACDQLIHDIGIGKLHIVLAIDRAGVVGEDGETHQGLFDISILSAIPNTVIYSPSCYDELKLCLKKAIYTNSGISAVRYPRGAEEVDFNRDYLNTDHILIQSGDSDVLVISYGRIYNEAYRARKVLEKEGIKCDLLKLTKIFPVCREIAEQIMKYKRIIFFEEAMPSGSISEKIGEMLLELGYSGEYRRVTAGGFVKQASIKVSLDRLGLTCDRMAEYVRAGRD